MTKVLSFDIETDNSRKARNPYGPGAVHSPTNTARTYLMFCLALFVIYGVGKMMLPAKKSNDKWASRGDAEGGWGSQHHHPIISNKGTTSGATNDWDSPVKHYHENPVPSHSSLHYSEAAAFELKETDFLMELVPHVFIPAHSRPEYEKYQTKSNDRGVDADLTEELLYDKNTPHGMAFDFLINRDTRPIHHDDPHLIQRFVLTLLFYATGGKDESAPPSISGDGGRVSGWDQGTAHFLTGLHECHWVKKSFDDGFWGILSIDSETDRRVGVTKCNADMDVTEIRLADLNLVGFIPEEIKWLDSLESFDIQNNHLAGPIPESMGELDELSYLSLDGNNFSGTIPDVFANLAHLERAYLNFNDFNGAMPRSLCILREEGALKDLWSDCGGYPITCTCCTVCCDMVSECNEMQSQKGG
mmetsp:Transcript_22139/g.47585  ORF Transcript_22139/g.47585 Transcript_22139/m.47585 type:complete len:416 (-) Transcript_22139:171-1418(-)|eukprot:CAMPEP_0172538284 /NCGR_PEP_ID=MMETSP1067-20121228/9690_1 /TAXON_ID=265564 ORGANISM="Thalassiosira punctigera, Strain Tpunct2005C2" /NCGR_SAMPLE_ID=MMETSP1067 /ASSEMBLY_ACC=CAM_ASM_000444 /LENGTH=415 /DNA_ID=CAMNT_0013323745 /DNA_START=189 /DNA_END=1436 /DNA_ORIENTATION=-